MQVVILTQEDCAFCEQAKAIMSRLAAEYELEVSLLELSSPEGQTLALQGGVMFPPGIFIGGEPFSYGRPSERALRREVERRIAAGGAS